MVYKQRGDQYDRSEIKRIKGTNWDGLCVGGLAMGRGRLYEASEYSGGSNPDIYGWAWYGRVFGPTEWKYSDGGTTHAYYWEGKTLTYTTLDSSHAVWNKGLGQDSMVNDGTTKVSASASNYSDTDIYITVISGQNYKSYKCSDSTSVENCDMLWKRHAGPVVARIKSYIAKNREKVAARQKKVAIMVASIEEKRKACGANSSNKRCGSGQASATEQRARLNAQEQALARASAQESEASEKRKQYWAEHQKQFEAKIAAQNAKEARERAAYEQKERARKSKENREALKQFTDVLTTVAKNEQIRDEERRREEEALRREQERKRQEQEAEQARMEAMQAQNEAERIRKQQLANEKARPNTTLANRAPAAPVQGTVIHDRPSSSNNSSSSTPAPIGHIDINQTGRGLDSWIPPQQQAAKNRERERQYQKALAEQRERNRKRKQEVEERERERRKKNEDYLASIGRQRYEADKRQQAADARRRSAIEAQVRAPGALTMSFEQGTCPPMVSFVNHTDVALWYTYEYTMVIDGETSFPWHMAGSVLPHDRARSFVGAAPSCDSGKKWHVPAGGNLKWEISGNY